MADFLAGLLSDSAGVDGAAGAAGAAGVAGAAGSAGAAGVAGVADAAGSAGAFEATGAVGVAGAIADSPEVLAAGDFSFEDDPGSEASSPPFFDDLDLEAPSEAPLVAFDDPSSPAPFLESFDSSEEVSLDPALVSSFYSSEAPFLTSFLATTPAISGGRSEEAPFFSSLGLSSELVSFDEASPAKSGLISGALSVAEILSS